MQNNFEKIIFYILKGLILIVPLFFWPWTASKLGIDNYNKLNLLILLAFLAVFIYLIYHAVKGRLKIIISRIDLPIIIFLGVSFLTALFGIDRFSSLFGSDSISLPFFGLLALASFYFLAKHLVKFENIYGLLKLALAGFFIVFISAFILLVTLRFGLIKEENFIVNYFNSSVGTLEDLSLYISVFLILIVSIISVKDKLFFPEKMTEILLKASVVLSFIFLAIINFSPAWVCLLAGSVILFAADYPIAKRRALLPAVLIFLSAVFLFLNYISAKDITENRMASKLQLDLINTMKVSALSLKDQPLLGVGQDNFGYVFSKYRSADLNNSAYWYLRYDKPYSYITGLISQMGIMGLLGYCLFLYFVFINAVRLFGQAKKLKTKSDDSSAFLIMAVLAMLIALTAGQFFYQYNATLWFLFWLLLAFFAVSLGKIFPETEREFVFDKTKKPVYFQNLIVVIWLLFSGWFILSALNARNWIAEAKSRRENDEGALIAAVKLNPYRYDYQINLAKFYLRGVLAELNKADADKDFNFIKDNINKGINHAKSAIIQAPNSVSAFETLGMIYGQMDKYSQDASGAAVYAFDQAVRLEPTNPVLAGELGKAYLANGQTDPAIAILKRSVELKADYDDGNLFLAKAYDQAGRYGEALDILKGLSEINNDPEINYEIGRVYFNEKKYDLAVIEFQKATTKIPNHANALYGLALAYEKLNDKKSALYYYKKVLALNPGNTEAVKKIGELESKE